MSAEAPDLSLFLFFGVNGPVSTRVRSKLDESPSHHETPGLDFQFSSGSVKISTKNDGAKSGQVGHAAAIQV